MTITTRPTRAGRVVIESDGRSEYYGGALVQGALIARVSAPAAVVERYTDSAGDIDLPRMLTDLDWQRMEASERRRDGIRPVVDAALLSVRVIERRRVQ
jgi:hypothetical protein